MAGASTAATMSIGPPHRPSLMPRLGTCCPTRGREHQHTPTPLPSTQPLPTHSLRRPNRTSQRPPLAALATSAAPESPVAVVINAVMLAGQTAHQLMLLLATQRGVLGGRGEHQAHPACVASPVRAHGSQPDSRGWGACWAAARRLLAGARRHAPSLRLHKGDINAVGGGRARVADPIRP